MHNIKSFWEITLATAIADFKLKNEGTWLGVLWYLLAPLFSFVILFFVFQDRLGQNIAQYSYYLLLGIFMFNYFLKITTDSITKIKEKAELIKSLAFPREAIIGGIVVQKAFMHFFEFLILVVFMLFSDINLLNILWYPLIWLGVTLFAFGVALFLSSLFIYFFDLEQIWFFVGQLIWFATPIFYEIGGQDLLYIFNLFNPMYYYISIARSLIIYSTVPDVWLILGALGFTILSPLIGLFVFSRLKPKFVEMI